MGTTLSRRGFLVGSSAVTAGVFVASLAEATSAAASPTTSTAWVLQTTNRCRCAACRAHAANRVFASSADASSGLAHPGCLCTVASLTISTDAYQQAFATDRVVDRRHAGVQAILSSSTAPVASPQVASPRSPAAPSPSVLPIANPAAAAPSDTALLDAASASAPARSAGPNAPAPATGADVIATDTSTGAGSAAVPPGRSNVVPPVVAGPLPVHSAQGRTVARLDSAALEWTPLPVAAVALALLVRFRNRRDEAGVATSTAD